jgi:hypothetical protein
MDISEEERNKMKEEIWKRLPSHYKLMRKILAEAEKETGINGRTL